MWMHEKPLQLLYRLPAWFRIACVWIFVLGLIIICANASRVINDVLAGGVLMRPVSCVEGEPGSPAIASNSGTGLFTFPASASNIQSSCQIFDQGTSIYVWFE